MVNFGCACGVDPGSSRASSEIGAMAFSKGGQFVRRSVAAWPLEAGSAAPPPEYGPGWEVFPQTGPTHGPRQQPRSSSHQDRQVGEGVGGNGGFRRPSCRLLEKGVGESADCGEEETYQRGGRGVPEIHCSFREADLRVGCRRAAEVGALDEAKARLSRLEAEQAAVPKVVSEFVPEVVPPPEWAAEVQRLREELERLRAGRSPVPVGHSLQSSAEAANLLQERAAKRRAGVAEAVPTNPQDVEGWSSEKHTELRDAIEFGDKESILALTELIRQGVLQCHKLPSTVGNMVA